MAATRITVGNNGSLKVEGDFELFDAAGNPYGLGDRKTLFICRCGQTKNSPLCDGSHKSCGFQNESLARDL
ncbi:MAG: CDGSH iron-sulfur domain-containing protein [Sumerlaeia bacterium]